MNARFAPFVLIGIGGALVALIGIVAEPAQGFGGLLTAAIFGLGIAMGAGIFVAIQGASGARWWAPLRSVANELIGTLAAPAALVVVTIVAGLRTLYPWAREGGGHEAHFEGAKGAWLNPALFVSRALFVLVVWLAVTSLLRSRAAALDTDKSPQARRRFGVASVLFLVVLAPTLSIAAWDFTMSLEPHWFSTMYSVYLFSGWFLSGLAAIAAVATALDLRGLLPRRLAPSTLHDLSKLLFGFATFWAYIWFCQYLLIWYSNLPEETTHYATRLAGGWSALFWMNPVLNFLVPFVALLSSKVKRRPDLVLNVAVVVLLGRWLDAYLMVGPAVGPLPTLPVYAIAATVALVVAMALRPLRSANEALEGDSIARAA